MRLALVLLLLVGCSAPAAVEKDPVAELEKIAEQVELVYLRRNFDGNHYTMGVVLHDYDVKHTDSLKDPIQGEIRCSIERKSERGTHEFDKLTILLTWKNNQWEPLGYRGREGWPLVATTTEDDEDYVSGFVGGWPIGLY